MNKSLVTIALIFIGFFTYAQSKLEVTVKNIKEQRGSIRVGLFNNEKDFLEKAIEGKVVKVSGAEVKVIFKGLKPGDYAVSVIHDENDNGDLDKNMMGIPKEGFGFGNNAMGAFGPPSFDKAKITLGNESAHTEISLKYF